MSDPNTENPGDPDSATCEGDPVDAGNGLFRYRPTDLVEPGPIPITLDRVYRQNDSNRYVFGRGVTLPYQMGLERDVPGDSCVILFMIPGQRRVRFVSPKYPANPNACDDDAEAETTPLVASASPGVFHNATLKKVNLSYGPAFYDQYWLLTRRDGTVYQFDFTAVSTGGRLIRIVDRLGNALIFDVQGISLWQLDSVVNYPAARWVKLSYIPIQSGTSKVISTASDAAGRTVTYSYQEYFDSGGGARLATVTDPENSVLPPANQKKTIYGWNPDHTLFPNPSPNPSPATQLLTITDPRGNVALTNVFDAQGRIDTQTLAGGRVWNYDFQSADPLCSGKTKIADPIGNARCLEVGSDGFLVSRTLALGTPDQRTWTYVRNATNKLVTTITDSFHSRVTRFTYGNGNVLSVTHLDATPNAVVDSYTYQSGTAALNTHTDPLNHTNTYAHDADGCITQFTDDAGKIAAFACTNFGLRKWVERYPGGVAQPAVRTTFSYARADLIKVTAHAGTLADPGSNTRSVNLFVDNAGNVRVVRDENRYETKLIYDRLNRLTSITDARGKVTALEYDANSNLTKITDPRSKITRFAYDAANRMFERTDQLNRIDTYTFDPNDNVKTWTDRRGNTAVYCHDAFDRVTFAGYRALQPSPTCASSFESTTVYDYDAGGRLIQVDDTGNGPLETITRTHDDLDRMLSEQTPRGTVSYTYDLAGRRQTMTVAGQPVVNYNYFTNDLLKSVIRGTETVSLAYDSANWLNTITLPNGVIQDYAYNAARDVTQIAYNGGQSLGALNYSYDQVGRRNGAWGAQARLGLPAATSQNAIYDDANRLTSWNGTALSYDLAGNLTQNGSQSYTWNARGELAGTSAGSSSFTYDAFGRRSSATGGGTSRRYVYDGWNAVQEQDGTGAVFANSIFGLGPDEVFWRKPTAASTGSSYLRDALGSTVALVNPSGASTTTYTYEPYGKPTSGDLTNPFTFTAREWDGVVGLQLNRQRYYSPGHGRFASEDPIGERGGSNLYQYANGAPTFSSDPFGLDPWEGCGFLGFGCIDLREAFVLLLDIASLAANIIAITHPGFWFAAAFVLNFTSWIFSNTTGETFPGFPGFDANGQFDFGFSTFNAFSSQFFSGVPGFGYRGSAFVGAASDAAQLSYDFIQFTKY